MVNIKFILSLINNTEARVNALVEWKLIPPTDSYPCPACGNFLELREHPSAPDGLHWVCSAKVQRTSHSAYQRCDKRVQFRFGTFFAKSKLSIVQV